MDPSQVSAWVLAELPRCNRATLRGDAPPGLLREQAREHLLPELPAVTQLTPAQAQGLVVELGLVGASIARHFQEHTPGGKERPEHAFDDLPAGAEQTPFRAYFAALAEHTGTGHCHRDSYASLVRWNVGTVRVTLGDEELAALPGVFADGRIRTYTGTAGEERFFQLVKKGEALESAVNDLLTPLTHEDVNLASEEALLRVRLATRVLDALRRLFVDFAALPTERTMAPEQFLDVFRQFAVHWSADDIPPSGALDPEALKRDFLLGIALPDYDRGVRRLLPALLHSERTEIEQLMAGPTLPERLLASLGLEHTPPAERDEADLRRLVAHHPCLADWHRLLTAHARAAGAHLLLSKKFLFKPQQQRDDAGLGDRPLVSNRAGTTGMTQSFLHRLVRARQRHPLAPLRTVLADKTPGIGVLSEREVAVELVG